jgi:hypothetical protein
MVKKIITTVLLGIALGAITFYIETKTTLPSHNIGQVVGQLGIGLVVTLVVMVVGGIYWYAKDKNK